MVIWLNIPAVYAGKIISVVQAYDEHGFSSHYFMGSLAQVKELASKIPGTLKRISLHQVPVGHDGRNVVSGTVTHEYPNC